MARSGPAPTSISAGAGTSVATTAGPITLGWSARSPRTCRPTTASRSTRCCAPSADYGTDAVAEGYTVYCHTDLEPDIRDLPNFTPCEKYASGKPMPNEIGKCERFRFITSPDLPSIQDAGAAIGSTGLYSTSGTDIDVYPFIVTAQDAWGQIAVRGKDALNPTFLPPGEKSKSDPHGQRGYAGTTWWKAVMIENAGLDGRGFRRLQGPVVIG